MGAADGIKGAHGQHPPSESPILHAKKDRVYPIGFRASLLPVFLALVP
jgi:hypothetical protein